MTPTPERRAVVASDRIYIQWSDDGQFIRKWSREPFEGGEAFSRQGSLDH